jgi:hypothetical protein
VTPWLVNPLITFASEKKCTTSGKSSSVLSLGEEEVAASGRTYQKVKKLMVYLMELL